MTPYQFWERFISAEENCTDISELDSDAITGKWWPVTYPESEATEISRGPR